MRAQQGIVGKILGGWQLGSFFTFQSGAPFTPLNGSDPTGALAGIDGLVGNAIRPNLNTNLDLSKMTIPEIIAAGGASLFRRLCGMPSAACPGERVGNVPRNSLRADGIGNVDLSLTKNTRFANGQNLQFRVEMFNATNTRNFGIPRRPRQLDELPESVGHRRRQSAHLAGRPVHFLSGRISTV